MLIAAQHIEPKWIDALREHQQTNNNTTEIVGVEQNKIDRNDNVYLTSFAGIIVIFVIIFTILILWRR